MTDTNDPTPDPMHDPREAEVQREYEARQAQKQIDAEKAGGLAGTALIGAGCLWYAILPFGVTFLVIILLLIFGVFGGD